MSWPAAGWYHRPLRRRGMNGPISSHTRHVRHGPGFLEKQNMSMSRRDVERDVVILPDDVNGGGELACGARFHIRKDSSVGDGSAK